MPKNPKALSPCAADELQLFHGFGPKMEGMLHDLGYLHFDQMANCPPPAEVAWVDDNLEGFKARVSGDKWQPQAKALARNCPRRT